MHVKAHKIVHAMKEESLRFDVFLIVEKHLGEMLNIDKR